MAEPEYFGHPISITCTTPGFRRAGIAHPAGPTGYPAGRFTVEQFAQLEAEPRLAVHVIKTDESDTESDLSASASGTLEPHALSELLAHIAELDPDNTELWKTDGSPKTEALPSGTTATERDLAWAEFKRLAADADIVESAGE